MLHLSLKVRTYQWFFCLGFRKGDKTMLSRELLQQQDRLALLNTISLRLIPALAQYADLDGLIDISEDEIKKLGYMTPKLVPTAMEGLLKTGWIRKSADGKWYCTYTCHTTPENKGFYYINLYKVFKKDTFKSMYKRRINLLYYILTSKIPGTWHSIAVERLYKNKTFAGKLAIRLFEDFDDLMNNLIPLIEAGIIEVKLGKSNVVLTHKTSNIKEQIYAFCGKTDLSARKKRMRGENDAHILHIRITDEVLKDKTTIFDEDRRSTLRDLEKIAAAYDYSLDVFSQEALEEVHMVKYKIYREFGNLGIAIYRESLQAFFEHSSHSFARLMENKEFGKVIKNHYVVPRIKFELMNAVKEAEQKQNLSKTEAFLRYFTTEAYPDDLVLFDQYMNNNYASLYENAKQHNVVWKEFANKVEDIYNKEASVGHARDFVVELAEKGELADKKRITEELNQKTITVQQVNKSNTAFEIPAEIREYREQLRAKGLLRQTKYEDDFDF
jgi:hypothetical protein